MEQILLLLSGSLFFLSLNLLTKSILNTFPGLSKADVYLITEKCVCSIQAMISFAVGFSIVYNCSNNIMTDSYWLTIPYSLFGLPYFPYDTWAIYSTHYYAKEKEMKDLSLYQKLKHFSRYNYDMLAHHILLPTIFSPIVLYLRNGLGDYFVGLFFCSEITIPFISIRFVMAQLNMKDSVAYIFFGLLMIAVFFITRIALFPFLYWKYGSHANIDLAEVPYQIPIKCNVGCAIILVLQLYFLFLMLRAACRVFYKIYLKHKNNNTYKKVNVD